MSEDPSEGVIRLECPNCRRVLKGRAQHIGKLVRCPSCAAEVLVGRERDAQQESIPPVLADPVPGTASPDESPAVPTYSSRHKWAILTAGIASTTLVVGYFLGREHVKYEMRSMIATARQELQEGLKDAFSFPKQPSGSNAGKDASLSPSEGDARNNEPREGETQGQPMATGDVHNAGTFALSLGHAKIGTVQVKSLVLESPIELDEQYLLLQLHVKNTDDRKLLTRREHNSFGPSYVRILDDVGNRIRGVDFGITSDVVGVLSPTDDILPGEEREHLVVFVVPPPKTKHLIVSIDLAMFGAEGEIVYQLEANEIDGFNREVSDLK